MIKNSSNLRLRKVLRRNSSQSNLRPLSHRKTARQSHEIDHNDKTSGDIFEIRSYFEKINGRSTNNIIELY